MKLVLRALAALALLATTGTAFAAPVAFEFQFTQSGTLNGATVSGTLVIDDQSFALQNWSVVTEAGPDQQGAGDFATQTYSSATGQVQDFGGDGFTLAEGQRFLTFFPSLQTIVENAPGTTVVDLSENDDDLGLFRSGSGVLGPALDPAVVEFASPTFEILETATAGGETVLQVRLRRTGNTDLLTTVDVVPGSPPGNATEGEDYTIGFLPTTVTWFQGDIERTVPLTVIDDTEVEGDETIRLALANASNATIGQVASTQITILDDDAPTQLPRQVSFTVATLDVDEAAGSATVTVELNPNGQDVGQILVDVASRDGAATAGADYTAVTETLAFGFDTTTATVTVPILDDFLDEDGEAFFLDLTNLRGTDSDGLDIPPAELEITTPTLTITILDDDLTGPDAGGDETVDAPPGETVEVVFPVTGTFPITVAAESGTVTPATLDAAGDVTWTFTLAPDETIGETIEDTVTLSDAQGGVTFKQIAVNVVAPQQTRDVSTIESLTPSQRQVAGYLDDLCPRLDPDAAGDAGDLASLCQRIRDEGTTDGQVAEALEAIKPEELVVMATSAVRLSVLQHGNLEQRINGLRSGGSGIDLAGLDLEIQGQTIPGAAVAEVLRGLLGGGASADDPFERWGLFADGRIKWGDKKGSENESAFDFDVAYVTLGADYRFRPNLIGGAAVSWGAVEADFDDGTNFDVESWSGSLFGSYYTENQAYVDLLLTWGRNDYDSERRIVYTDAGGTIDRIARGDTDGSQFSGGLSGGWDWNRGAFTAGPHLGVYYMDLEVDGFRESGAGGLDLDIGRQEAQSFTVNGGLHASYVWNLPFGVLIPHVRADAVRELEDQQEQVAISFANDPFLDDATDPTLGVTLETDRPDDEYFVFSGGVSAQFVRGVSGYVNYQYTSSLRDWSISNLSYGMRFERTF